MSGILVLDPCIKTLHNVVVNYEACFSCDNGSEIIWCARLTLEYKEIQLAHALYIHKVISIGACTFHYKDAPIQWVWPLWGSNDTPIGLTHTPIAFLFINENVIYIILCYILIGWDNWIGVYLWQNII